MLDIGKLHKNLLIFLIFTFLPCLCYAQTTSTTSGIILEEEGSSVGRIKSLNCVGSSITCTRSGSTGTITDSGGGGSGDAVTVNSTAADTTANFLDGNIDWTLVDGGPGGPDSITGTLDPTYEASLDVATAVALAADGADCTAGSYPLGVDASGAAQSCTDATTEIDSAIATHAAIEPVARIHATDCTALTDGVAGEFCYENDSNNWYVCEPSAGLCDTAGEWFLVNANNAVTATALAADPADCSVNQFANAINASGTLSCGAIGDADVPDTITIDNATTAANLGADGVDALTEIAQGIKTAADDTSKLVVGTAGSNGEIAKWNTDGTLTDSNVIIGTLTDGQYCTYTSAGTVINCDTTPAGSGDVTDVGDCSTGACFTADGTGNTLYLEGATADGFETIITSADITVADKTFTFPNDEIALDDLIVGTGAGTFGYTAKSAINLSDFNDDLTHTTDTNANTICSGTTTYLDGEGNCDDISSVYQAAGTYLTASGSVALTGEQTVDDLGLEFTPGDALTDCSTFSATGGGIFYDDSEGKFKKCQDNTLTDLDTGGSETNSLETVMTGVLDDEIPLGSAADTAVYTAITNCTDTGGNHLNYTAATNTFSCGTSSSITDQVGTVTSGNLCTADGSAVQCTTTPGTGVLTALAENVNGSGAISLTTSPTFVTPVLGVASATSVVGSITLAGDPALAANTASPSANGIIFEGATANTIETLLTAADPTVSDKTITLPNATGTVSLTNGNVNTGTHDFGGAVLEIPNGAAVTDPAVAGEVAIDTTTDQFLYYGGAQRVLHYQYEKCIALSDATNVSGNNYPVLIAPAAITVVADGCRVEGTSATIDFESTSDVAIDGAAETCSTTTVTWDETMTGTATFAKGAVIEMDVDASSAATRIIACIRYTIDPD